MGFKYTSLEDGQVITTDEPREDLDELARWVRSDAKDEAPITTVVPPSPGPVAGPVNTSPVSGGEPPLVSASAGIFNPADALTPEQAAARAAEQLASGSADESKGSEKEQSGSGEQGGEAPERPGLNGSTEDWRAYAKHPSIALDIADDASRDDIIAAYIAKFAPAGNASRSDWAAYAGDHGVQSADDDGRDKIRADVIEAGWAKA